jgi:hypothetical protein
MSIKVRLGGAIFECQTAAEAVELARLWHCGKGESDARTQPQTIEQHRVRRNGKLIDYRPTVRKFLEIVRNSMPQGIAAADALEKIGDHGGSAGIGTLIAMARKILAEFEIELPSAVRRERRRIDGKDTKLWKAGPDIGRAIEALRKSS